jgi:hypothetical protein
MASPIVERHFQGVYRLLAQCAEGEGLRTPDAMQVAIALDLRRGGIVETMLAADQRLC